MNYRKELGIEQRFVYGLHQFGGKDSIYSPWILAPEAGLPLRAYKEIEDMEEDVCFLLMSNREEIYQIYSKQLGLKNFFHVEFRRENVLDFLKSLDVYAHGFSHTLENERILEAISVGVPIISHFGYVDNSHTKLIEETTGSVHGCYENYVGDLHHLKLFPDYRNWRSKKTKEVFKKMCEVNL